MSLAILACAGALVHRKATRSIRKGRDDLLVAFVEFRDVRKVYRMGEVEVAAVEFFDGTALMDARVLLARGLADDDLPLVGWMS